MSTATSDAGGRGSAGSGGSGGVVAGALVLAGVLLMPILLLFLGAAFLTSEAAAATTLCGPGGAAGVVTAGSVGGPGAVVGSISLSAEQLANAQTITGEVVREGLPQRAAVISIATALQESSLENLHSGDRDSLGLYQQRPSQGYDAAAAVNPAAATAAFLHRLVALPGWQSMALTDAAAQVQRPAESLRGEYARWEPIATQLATRYWPAGTPTTGTVSGPSPSAGASGGGVAAGQVAAGVDAGACPGEGGDGITSGSGPTSMTTLPSGVVLDGTAADKKAAQFAIAQLGKPYVWGGTGPDGWDCSGLMLGAWATAGVALPRTSQVQSTVGTPVTLAQARTGDLVFIPGSDGTPQAPGHVGMILGTENGQLLIIQAPHTGDVVKITPASSWASQITGLRRVG